MSDVVRAAATVAHKDRGTFRQSAFEYLAAHKKTVTLARSLYRLLGKQRWAATLLVSGYGIASFLRVSTPNTGRLWSVGRYRNEERQFAFVQQCAGVDIGRVQITTSAAMRSESIRDLLNLLMSPAEVIGGLRLIHRYGESSDFLVSCRVAATVGYTARFRRILSRHTNLDAIIVSSDTNPYATSICEVARDMGIPRVYITHGHMPSGPPRVDFDLWLLDGPELKKVYDRVAPVQGAIAYKGAEGTYQPLRVHGLKRRRLAVGYFASLLVDWEETAKVIQSIRATLNPSKILIRFHPNQTIRDPAAHTFFAQSEDIKLSDGETLLTDDADQCDLVFAGNSSCHLTLLKYGTPTVYVPGLDIVPHDFYGFLRDRIVPEFPTPQAVCSDSMYRFYSDPKWVVRFQQYDASYMKPDNYPATQVRAALNTLLSRSVAANTTSQPPSNVGKS
ncbi:MAG: hypothetical protein VX223_09060 [Myxococcota bacterium]|nr:hypothetical protein [Myxococcota bacterium]